MRTQVILGPAGSGKSYNLKKEMEADPNYAKLCATTGIAAINLGPGVTTINSVLGFFNDESALDALERGQLTKRFIALARAGFKNLVVDEVSMMSANLLSIITQAAQEAHETIEQRGETYQPAGLILTGDWLQLPPVRGRFAFLMEGWDGLYQPFVQQLTKIWRQSDPLFLEALTCARQGKGIGTVQALVKAGVKFHDTRDDYFSGTTLVPTNKMADAINVTRFEALEGTVVRFPSRRWGVSQSEWKDIPEVLELKEGAQVMVLANGQDFAYVNGDQGIVGDLAQDDKPMVDADLVEIELHRSVSHAIHEAVHSCTISASLARSFVGTVFRTTEQKAKPDEASEYVGFLIDEIMLTGPRQIDRLYQADEDRLEEMRNGPYATMVDEMLEEAAKTKRKRFAKFRAAYDSYVAEAVAAHVPYFNVNNERWVVGWIEYMPIRLAYASTIHKTQGLTLDRIQIDARQAWRSPQGEMCGAGAPAMMYVALSRCRTADNIRIVASLADFSKRVNTAKECQRWI